MACEQWAFCCVPFPTILPTFRSSASRRYPPDPMPFRLHLETTPTPIAPETGAHKAHQRAPTGSTHQVSQRGEFLFPASRAHVRGKPTTTFNGWPKYKEAFDKLCGVTDWTLHDLRRTLTNLAALKVPPH